MGNMNSVKLLELSQGKIWKIPVELRLQLLHDILDHGVESVSQSLPTELVNTYRKKKELKYAQDVVSLFVDWISAHLLCDERPAFDLSVERAPQTVPRVLLVSPSYSREETSIGLVRITAFLRGLGISADWHTVTVDTVERVVHLCKTQRYDIIGQGTTHYTLRKDLELIERLHNVSPASRFILGGHGAVFSAQERIRVLTDTPISIIVRGFGERSVARLALQYSDVVGQDHTSPLNRIPGIYYLDGNRECINTGKDCYNQQDYRAINAVFDPVIYPVEEGTSRLVTSTHCPRACVFCSSTHFFGQQPIRLYPVDVAHMIGELVNTHPKLSRIEFNDDDFFVNCQCGSGTSTGAEWISLLSEIIRPDNICNISTSCFARADMIDTAALTMLIRRLNLRTIGIGLEHVDKDILHRMKKGCDPDRVVACIRNCIKLGLDANFFVILFSKWETPESLVDLISTSTQLCLEGAHVVYNFGFQPLPGAIVTRASENRYIQERYSVGRFYGTYREKILPIDPFMSRWFAIMSEKRNAFYDLQDQLSERFLKHDIRKTDGFKESLWFKTVLSPHTNMNRSITIINLIRFHSMFLFGMYNLDENMEYFNTGANLTLAAIVNYIYNGPTFTIQGYTSIGAKVEFLRNAICNENKYGGYSDLIAELEVAWTGMNMPEVPGVSIGRHIHEEWAARHIDTWRERIAMATKLPEESRVHIETLSRSIGSHLF